jgi:putative membrane protein
LRGRQRIVVQVVGRVKGGTTAIDSAGRSRSALELTLLGLVLATLVWSGIAPFDRLTWVFETIPVWIGVLLLVSTYQRFRFTSLVYALIAAHCVLLCVGGHYTYTRVPLFDWIKEWAGFSRNHYDRLGHLAQGFVPAMIARELLVRLEVVRGKGWLFTIVVALCLGVSVLYELAEAAAGISLGGRAEDFLAMQGDQWDTHADLFLALIGAVSALLLLSSLHDRCLRKLELSSGGI